MPRAADIPARRVRRPRDNGFTLAELVIAMVIIAGVLMALIAVQISAAQTIVDARKREQATAIGNQALEQLRAIPWTYLNLGLDTDFATAAGGDPYLVGTAIRLPGTVTLRTLKRGDQDLSKPRPPLFDEFGSNKAVVSDAAETNTSFTVRSYVLEPDIGSVNTVGLVVIVTWEAKGGKQETTVVESTAYRGSGCGDPDEAPYLATCQATFEGIASSGVLTTSVHATTTPDNANPTTELNLLYPTSDIFASLAMRSASVGVSAQGQQVANVRAVVQFGGSTKDDADGATQPAEQNWIRGFAVDQVRATDNVNQTGTPLHQNDPNMAQGGGAEDEWELSAGGTDISFRTRSDFLRPVSGMASSTTSCKAGIPIGEPCATVTMGNNTNLATGSGYLMMRVGSQDFRLSRRVVEGPSPTPPSYPVNYDHAWIAKYGTTQSTDDNVGCRPVSGAGCIATGATRHMARLAIGTVVGGSWSGGQATEGLIVVEGRAACTGGSNVGFTETVMVQRGSSQRSELVKPSVTTRCGQARWWNGTGYSTTAINNLGFDFVTTAPVTWTGGGYTVTATGSFNASSASTVATGTDAFCALEPCAVQAQTGTVNITVVYVITGPGVDYAVTSITTIEGPSASVIYQEAPSVAVP